MTNTKERKNFRATDLPIVKVKGKSRVYSPSKELAKARKVARALKECVKDGDFETFDCIFNAHLKAIEKLNPPF